MYFLTTILSLEIPVSRAEDFSAIAPGIRGLAAVSSNSQKWPGGKVRYSLRQAQTAKSEIRKALQTIKDAVGPNCLEFIEDNTGIQFKSGYNASGGCFADLGYKGGRRQTVNLGLGCDSQGTIMHEIYHALGVYHTQTRTDRDRHVSINERNAERHQLHNFKIATSSNNYGLEYDFDSIMHYHSTAFSTNRRETITARDSKNQNKIKRHKNQLSDGDIELMKRLYGCSEWNRGSGGNTIKRNVTATTTKRPAVTFPATRKKAVTFPATKIKAVTFPATRKKGDINSDCELQKANKQCEEWPEYYRQFCKETCFGSSGTTGRGRTGTGVNTGLPTGFRLRGAGGNTGLPTGNGQTGTGGNTGKDDLNTQSDCAKSKADGKCEEFPKYFKQWCNKTCFGR